MGPFYLESLVSNRLVTRKIRCFRLRIMVNYPSVPKAVNMGRTVMLLLLYHSWKIMISFYIPTWQAKCSVVAPAAITNVILFTLGITLLL